MARSGSARVINNSLNKLMSIESNESPKVKPEQESTGTALNLDFSYDGLLNAIVLSEVLGKPKCLKRGRR